MTVSKAEFEAKEKLSGRKLWKMQVTEGLINDQD